MIRGKAGEYMERAEKLKKHLEENDKSNRKKPSAVGANGKVSGGSGKGKCVSNDKRKRFADLSRQVPFDKHTARAGLTQRLLQDRRRRGGTGRGFEETARRAGRRDIVG